MKRRSFFKSLAKAAAIVALAPQIAFRIPARKEVEFVPAWRQDFIALFARECSEQYRDALEKAVLDHYQYGLTQVERVSPSLEQAVKNLSPEDQIRLVMLEENQRFNELHLNKKS